MSGGWPRSAVVTWAGSGLGLALADRGARVIGLVRWAETTDGDRLPR